MSLPPTDDLPPSRRDTLSMQLVERLNLAVWEWDLLTNALHLSPGWNALLGYADNEILGDLPTYLSLLHPDDREKHESHIRAILHGTELWGESDQRFRHKDGSSRWLLAKYRIERDVAGNAIQVACVNIDITRQKILEQELVDSTKAMRQAQRLARTGHWIWHPGDPALGWHSGTTERSDIVAELYGINPSDLKKSNVELFESCVHPDDKDRVDAAYSAVINPDSEGYEIEFRIVRLDGETRTLHELAEYERDSAGHVVRARGTIQDITKQKQTEVALVENQAHIREAHRSGKMGHWLSTSESINAPWETTTTYRSEGVAEILDIPAEEIPATDEDYVDRFVHPDDRERLISNYRKTSEGKQNRYSVEYRIVAPNGNVKTLHETGERYPDPLNRRRLWRGLIRDVTEHKDIETALRRSEFLYRTMMEQAFDAFILIDTSDQIIEWSARAHIMFGWSREEVLGKKLADKIIPPDQRATHRRGLEAYRKNSGFKFHGRRRELLAMRRDGTVFPVEVTVWLVETDTGPVFSSFTRDLTEQRELENRLRQAFKMETIGQVTGGVAHDFNNLLAVILGAAESLHDNEISDPDRKTTVEQIIRTSQQGADLIQRLLTFSRRQPLNPANVDLNDAIDEMLPVLKQVLRSDIEVEITLSEDSLGIFVDVSQIQSAFLNLAINARDAMPKGGVLRIETRADMVENLVSTPVGDMLPGRYATLSVADTGIGIAPETQARMFEPFFTTKDVGKGSGLGLSMIYGFVKQSGGFVTARSELGKGTTISLHFPRSESMAFGKSVEMTSTDVGGNETILVVEDNADVRKLIVSILSGLGYRSLVAANAAEGLLFLTQRKDIDLLVTDYMMPGTMNGVELARKAVAMSPSLHVIIVSGNVSDESSLEDPTGGQISVLKKPFRRHQLAARVRQALDRRQ